MFYKLKLKDHVRVPPTLLDPNLPVKDAIIFAIKHAYTNMISQDLGVIIDVLKISKIYDGIIIPGDGASYYDTEFELLTFKPELNELVYGKIRDITDFGAFIDIGGVEGMVHVSQSMDDFVSFSKEKVLQGKKTGQSLKVGDKCKARIIAVSYKDLNNPKIGLSMRQEGLGKLEWLNEATKQEKTEENKE